MKKKVLVAALMCVLIPLASHAIPITNLDKSSAALKGYSPASSSALASIILSKGFSIKAPSSNPPSITLDKPSQPNSSKTTKTAVLKKKPAPQLTPPLNLPVHEVLIVPEGGEHNGSPGQNNGTAAPVPEPATMLLLGSGLLGVATLKKLF